MPRTTVNRTLSAAPLHAASIAMTLACVAHAQGPAASGEAAPPSATTGAVSSANTSASAPAPEASRTETAPPSEFNPDALRFSISPYLWAASVDGTISGKGLTTSFDVSFRDVLKDLDFALMVHGEVAWRRLFLFGDYEYINIGSTVDINQPLLTSADVPKLLSSIQANDPNFGSGPFAQKLLQAQGNLAAVQSELAFVSSEVAAALAKLTPEQRKILSRLAVNRLDPKIDAAKQQAQLNFAEKEAEVQAAILAALAALSPGPELNSVQSTMTLQIAEFGGGYRVLEWQLGVPWNEQEAFGGMNAFNPSTTKFPTFFFDVLGGARYYNMGYDSTVYFTPDKFQILPSIVDIDETTEWVDPVVGGRIGLAFDKNWRVWCRGDAGGFQSTQNSWCVQGGVEWAPASWFSLIIGYRALHIDYLESTDGFGFDGTLQGPVLGCTFTF